MASDKGASVANETEGFTFRVVGTAWSQTFTPRAECFDETYKIEGEHPAEALEKLLREIEWGILDAHEGFTIDFIPTVE